MAHGLNPAHRALSFGPQYYLRVLELTHRQHAGCAGWSCNLYMTPAPAIQGMCHMWCPIQHVGSMPDPVVHLREASTCSMALEWWSGHPMQHDPCGTR